MLAFRQLVSASRPAVRFAAPSHFSRPVVVRCYASTPITTKKDIIKKVSESLGDVDQKTVEKVVNGMLDTITTSLKAHEKITFVGFGTFETKTRAARAGRNPKTGVAISIPETNYPSFSAGKTLKDAIKGTP